MRAAAHLDLGFPFRGTWLVQNSPANRLPSHGTTLFASCCAIDSVPVDQAGRSAPIVLRSLTRSEPPERFPGFGRPILSPCDGVVVTTHDGLPDHHAYRGWSSLGYALGQRRRATAGWIGLAGNHVAIDTGAPSSSSAICGNTPSPSTPVSASASASPSPSAATPGTAPNPTSTCRRSTPSASTRPTPCRSRSGDHCPETATSSMSSPEEGRDSRREGSRAPLASPPLRRAASPSATG
jgi:hypothetical protein